VTASTQRLPPALWAKFAAASLIMKVRSTQLPEKIFEKSSRTLTDLAGYLGLIPQEPS